MGKISNCTIIFIVICLLTIFVITYSTFKINETHESKLYYSVKSNVKYYAERCYLEEMCKDTVTLNDLYNLGYLTKEVINPVTKEVVDPSTLVNYINGEVIIDFGF